MRLKLDTYIITNADIVPGRDHIQGAREALRGGVDAILFREKKMDHWRNDPCLRDIQTCCRLHHAIFIVNDRVDVALAMDATVYMSDRRTCLRCWPVASWCLVSQNSRCLSRRYRGSQESRGRWR